MNREQAGQGEVRWRSVDAWDYFGCEAEVVFLVMKYEDIRLEFLSRARRQLVILTQDLRDKRKMLVFATDKEGNNIFSF